METDSQEKVKKDIKDTVRAIRSIENHVIPKLISGTIIEVESEKDELKKTLDVKSGIDYFREDQYGLQGIASRVQFGYIKNTFTIRTERESGNTTELEKRIYAIIYRYLYPEFTWQAYFDNSTDLKLYSIAIIKTIDLFGYYLTHPKEFKENESNAKFIYIEWERLKEKNLRIKIYEEAKKDFYIDTPF
jgi:hypothetical protein